MVGRGLGRWIGIPRAYETVACFKKGEREREREEKKTNKHTGLFKYLNKK